MSIHWDKAANQYVVRFRDAEGRHRGVTANVKNLAKYGLPIPGRITQRVDGKIDIFKAKVFKDFKYPKPLYVLPGEVIEG